MAVDLHGERGARGTALRGAGVGLALAAALLVPALVAGGVPARGDLADFFWPMKAWTATRWAQGAMPLWNPLAGGGEAWLAQLQSGALYPGDLPFLLGWRTGAFLGIALHLALAAAGCAFWLWELGASRPAALLAGGLYAGGGAYLSLVPVYNNACTAAWLPWLFAGARRAVLGRSRGAGFAVAVAGAFLAGEPALAAAGSLAALALALLAGREGEVPSEDATKARLTARTLVPLAVGIALAGAALVPFGSLVASSERRARTTREEALALSVGPSELADLVAAPRPESTRSHSPGRGGYLVTLAFGPLPLLLAAGAGAGLPGRRRLLGGLAAVGTIGFLLSLGSRGLLAPLLYDAGLLHGLRYPARWFVFTHLALVTAAGAGLDGWLWGRLRPRAEGEPEDWGDAGRREERSRRRFATAVLGAGLLLAALLGVFSASPDARPARDARRLQAGGAALLLGAVGVAVSRRRSGGPTPAAAGAVTLLALAPLPFLAGEALAAVPAAAVAAEPRIAVSLPRGPEAGRVFAPAGQDRTLALRWRYSRGAGWGAASVAQAADALSGYTNLFHGIATSGSASPLGNPRQDRLVGSALAGADPAKVLSLLGVRWVVTPFPTKAPGLRLEAERDGVRLYAVPGAFGRAFFPDECVRATDDEAFDALRRPGFDPGRTALVAPDEGARPLPAARPAGGWAVARFLSDEDEKAVLTTSASAPSLLVLTRSWDAGWEARVDGQAAPTARAQIALLAVVVPAGEHRLELVYRPASFRAGLGLSAAGLVGLLALALSGPPARRPT